jgi:tetratricopeptide (TPR) repeat protein
MQVVQQLNSEDLRQRIEGDLQTRLEGMIAYDVTIDPFGPDDVKITYTDGRYQVNACLAVGLDEQQYALTIDYVIEWIGDHQEDLAYKSDRPSTPVQPQGLDKVNKVTEITASELPFSSPKEQAVELNTCGYYLAESGKWTEAIPFYQQALSLDPNHIRAWTNLGNAFLAVGQVEEAITCHERSLAIDPRFDLAWANKAVALSALERLEEAIICYEQALTIDPYNTITWFNKGSVQAKAGRHDEAIACYDHILCQLDSRYYRAMLAKAESLKSLGRPQEALVCLDEALTIAVDDVQIWHWKASILRNLEQLPKAMAAIEHAIEIDSSQAANWNEKGVILYNLANYEEAIGCYELAIDLEPTHKLAWFNKGGALFGLNRYREALSAFMEAGRLGHPEAAQAEAICRSLSTK